jgi:hypothetical protein
MGMTRLLFSAVLVLAGSVLASPALASDASSSQHSGVVVSIDTAARKLRLEEMGPWMSEATKPVTRSIDFGPDTKFEMVTRPGRRPSGLDRRPRRVGARPFGRSSGATSPL